jgi:DNA-binding NarL/FixJ family response regulator
MPLEFSKNGGEVSGSEARTEIGSAQANHAGRPVSMRILLADDHGMVRETISAYLTSEGRAAVVAVSDYFEAMKALEQKGTFDLVLLDFSMPGMNGLQGLTDALAKYPEQPIAIVSGTAPNKVAQEALDAGAIGFLPKTMGAKSLVNAVRFMIAGESFVPPSVMAVGEAAEETAFAKQFSQREKEVLTGLCKGHSNKEIARDLDLQEVTIKLHVRTLCKKLNAKNRTQAALIAKEAGFE